MKPDHKRKFEGMYEQEDADTTISKRPFTLVLSKWFNKYGRHAVFVVGLGLFLLGVIGEYLDVEGYTFYSQGRLSRDEVVTYPYWFSCVYGGSFMLLAIRRSWVQKHLYSRFQR